MKCSINKATSHPGLEGLFQHVQKEKVAEGSVTQRLYFLQACHMPGTLLMLALKCRDFASGPVAKTPVFPRQGARVRFLVRELQ